MEYEFREYIDIIEDERKPKQVYKKYTKEDAKAYVCECGSVVNKNNKSQHFKTNIHQTYIKYSNDIQFDEDMQVDYYIDENKVCYIKCPCGKFTQIALLRGHYMSKQHDEFVRKHREMYKVIQNIDKMLDHEKRYLFNNVSSELITT